MAIGEFALGVVLRLVGKAVSATTSYAAQSYFQRLKIDRAVEAASASVVETFEQFFEAEGISDEHQMLIVSSCEIALQDVATNPSQLFEGSLDGERIYVNSVAKFGVPKGIIDLHLEAIYELIFIRIATIVCQVPVAVKNWEYESWSENYRRLDVIADSLRSLFERVDAIDGKVGKDNARTVSSVRRYLAQRIALKLDLTGLRGDKPMTGSMDDFFVHPEMQHVVKTTSGQRTETVSTASEALKTYLAPGVRAILVGAPGSGKSTWSRWLQGASLGENWHGLPVRVELRALDLSALPSLHEVVKGAVGVHFAEGISATLIEALAKSGDICLILDGLDEVSIADRGSVVDWIDDLVAFAPACPIIVTTRPLSSNHLSRMKGWKEWTFLAFDAPRIEEYVRRWYKFSPLIEGGTTEFEVLSLTGPWRTDPTIGPLTGNPLLLSTLLMVHHIDGSLPSGRAELYARYVSGMLGVWDDRRRVVYSSVNMAIGEKRRVLEEIALFMQLSESDEITEEKAVEITSTTLEKLNIRNFSAEDVLSSLRERSGLLVGPGTYNFAHKSISEFLVAHTIVEGHRVTDKSESLDRFYLFGKRRADRWNVVLFLWAGSCATADLLSFIAQCFASDDEALACGLIADQYSRIVSAGMNRFLPDIKRSIRIADWSSGGAQWVLGGSRCETEKAGNYWSPMSLEAPSAYIASIAGAANADFEEFIGRLCGDNYLSSSDLKGLRGGSRLALWSALLDFPNSIEAYAAAVGATPSGAKQKRWLFWVLERATWRRIRPTPGFSAVSAEEKLTQITKVFPDLEGVALVAAISATVQQLFRDDPQAEEQMSAVEIDEFQKLLPSIVDSSRFIANLDCLKSTVRWEVWSSEDGETEIDAIEYLQKLLARSNALSGSSDYSETKKIADNLKRDRDKLQ